MNPEKNEIDNKLIIDTFIQDQTRKPQEIRINIHPQDEMYLYALKNTEGNIDEALLRYFSNGKRILDAVKQIVEWHFDGFENISSFLDFASGYGRFSRFLVQEIPVHKIWISDIYPQAVEFQKKLLGVEGIVSTNHPEDYQLNQIFDCIFACSFFSHTPQKTFSGWLEKLYSLLTEKGILIFSTHDLSLMTIDTETDAEEIYFTPESESLFLKTEDYGVTYVGEKWVGKIIHQATKGKAKWHRIKKGLCGYHDLYILWNKEGRRKKEEGRSYKIKSQNSKVIKEEVFINSKVKSQNSEVGKEEVGKGEAINSKVKSQNSEVGKEEVGKGEAINSKVKSQNSEVVKGEVGKGEVKKEEVEEQRDKLLNFYCHPDGGCRSIEVTSTGDIYIEGWAANINPEEKVEEVAVLVNGIKVKSCLPKYESKTQEYQWSCTINSEYLSPDGTILVKIINNFHLERVVNIFPVNSIVLLPPNHLLLRISGNSSVKAFLSSFDDLKYTVKNYLQKAGFDFHQFENILDFGCGVGRYLMAFKPELLPNQKLFGCDVFAECTEWCKENIKFATVKHNNIQPPLPFENNQFDLVNAVSVFTHLRLDLQHLWAWDIYRVLRPGGILFMTLHGPQFFPIIYDIFRTGNTHQAEMYSIGEEGLFLYLDHQGETDGQGQHTVAAVHTPGAYQEIFSMFKHIKRFPQSTMANGQDLYILQKPISGGLVVQPLSRKKEEGRGKKEEGRRKKEEVFHKSEVIKEEVGNAEEEIIGKKIEEEEIIGKKIEVEKILISNNEETKNLSDKILSDSQTKREVKTEVEELPLFDGEETWKFVEKILPGSDKCQTEIKFKIEGQKRFRVFPQIEPIAAYSIECEIEILKSEDGKILVQKTIPFNQNHIFGKTNYAVVEVEIPQYFGEVVVRLNAVITDRISLVPEQEVIVSWNFANFA
ncbi:MAG: methyltransferase [Okeania sp. SIO2C9]|uniref:methyltransferase n=1 Tax=Okeania sp. SIO2C9 TaxID=2607791 RepID=UPI0013C0DB19|nr:methyltransferase [Okeania sp. SIO2C9]NEQ77254.1 methyltransferase [Okeania sp. SIO2C9]